jgi:hypothetical protein
MFGTLHHHLRSQWREAVLFAVLFTCFVYFFPRWADWNQNSRLNLVMAIVDHGTVRIDRYVENTGDYARIGGHYYSDKAPGLSLAGVPIYAALRLVLSDDSLTRLQAGVGGALAATLRPDGTGLLHEKLLFSIALTATTAVTVAAPSALLAVVFFKLTAHVGGSVRQRVVSTLLYALGTSAFPYSHSFVGHQLSAGLVFIGFALLFAIRRATLPRSWLTVVGVLLGYAVITEYPVALIVGVLGVYALGTIDRPLEVAARLSLGAAAPLALLAIYDLVAFGTILPVGYLHSTLWTEAHQTGLVSLSYPRPEALWGITFGLHRGLFVLSPYLLLALIGYRAMWHDRHRRPEFWVLLATPVLFLLFNASSVMWQGGFAVGPRYLVPALPFLAVAAHAGLARAWRRVAWRPLIVLICGWSVGTVWAQTIAGQSFPDYSANPLIEFSLPRLMAGDIARNLGMVVGLGGWMSLLPLLVVLLTAGLALAERPFLSRRSADSPPRSARWVSR